MESPEADRAKEPCPEGGQGVLGGHGGSHDSMPWQVRLSQVRSG